MINLSKNIGAGLGAAGLCGLMLVLSATASAAPNQKSVADVVACLEDESTVRACSSKELSNVVVQCTDGESSYYIKYDDLEDLVDPYIGFFSCPGGTIEAVFVKSGSDKIKSEADGLPSGSGTLWNPSECPVDCPATGEEEGEDPGTEPPPDGETPQ